MSQIEMSKRVRTSQSTDFGRGLAIVRNEFRTLRGDPFVVVILFIIPVIIMYFFRPLAALALQSAGYHGADGSDQVVPGVFLMFEFMVMGIVGFSIVHEHDWNTWDRLRSSGATPWEIMLGKGLFPFVLGIVQFFVLYLVSWGLFGARIPGNLGIMMALSSVVALCMVTMGFAIATIFRSAQQVNLFTNLCIILLSSLGGAFVPLWVLPGALKPIAPITPTYWAMRGYREIIIAGRGFGALIAPCLVLGGYAGISCLIAARQIRNSEHRMIG